MSTATPNWLSGRHALIAAGDPAAQAVAASLAAHGATITWTDPSQTDAAAIETLFATTHPIDILIHAGTNMPHASAETIDLAAWRATECSDIDGRFLFAAEFARRRIAAAQPGNILFLMPSASPQSGRSAALTAHGALDNLVKSLAVEWGRDGIRINAIASHAVSHFADATLDQRQSLANLAAYLVSDYAAYITGSVAGIDDI
jgi:NAD(P)-dependent dehydrogenase (short-subunit alcohol dehydrogenase family)